MSENDLATQISALVVSAFFLFVVTCPSRKNILDEAEKNEDCHALRGIQRYSSYHRKRCRRYSTLSSSSSSSSSSTRSGKERLLLQAGE
jgi:hypothetical protein